MSVVPETSFVTDFRDEHVRVTFLTDPKPNNVLQLLGREKRTIGRNLGIQNHFDQVDDSVWL